ncbi:hypothetical protein C8R46DRAFT_42421 [Mycena filopes]|nr:hypothetical protein C8R46DRAFT_42421 [Mycena filopes]
MDRLPQEIVEEIIDRIADVDDYRSPSVQACSLVSRAWLSRTRLHLFATCTLLPGNITSFCDLLLPSSTFLPHVRTIDASGHYWTQNDRNSFAPLRRLPTVRTLKISFCFLATAAANADVAFSTALARAFPHITKIDIVCMFDGYYSETPLFDMLSLFPALEDMGIRLGSSFPSMHPPPPPPGLRRLSMNTHAAGPILDWLHAFGRLPIIESLELPVLTPHAASMISAKLPHLTGILYLEIGLIVDPITIFDLSLLPNLRTLVVSNYTAPKFDPSKLMPLLSTLPALIERITFRPKPTLDDTFNWRALDELLCSPLRFSHLRRVIFMASGFEEETILCGVLPLLTARAVLHVETC